MEKKMVGILAGVAAVHVVALAGLMASGGCRQPAILGTQTYNDGPAMEKVPSAQEAPPVAAPETPAPGTVSEKPAAVSQPKAPPALTSVPPAAKTAAAPAAAGESVYKVVKGDSLSRIAYKHGLKTKELAAYNNLDLKSTLKVGQELKIPAGGTYVAPAPKSDKSADKPAAKSGASAKGDAGSDAKSSAKSGAKAKIAELPADGIHVVVSGDSLDRIGRKYGVSAKAIADENNIALTKVLHVGDKLHIPAKSAAKKSAAKKADGKKTPAPAEKATELSTDDLNPDLPISEEKTSPATGAASAEQTSEQTSLLTNTESLQVPKDMTAEEFCRMHNVKMDDLKRMNPDLPADGKLKGGQFLIVPRLQ